MTQVRQMPELKYDDRLSAHQFNSLLRKIKINNKELIIQEGFIRVDKEASLEQDVTFFVIQKNIKQAIPSEEFKKTNNEKSNYLEKKFVIFEVTKDDVTPDNIEQIPNIKIVLQNFQKNYPELFKSSLLLLPMVQCQNLLYLPTTLWTGLRRDHLVLVEVQCENNRSAVHDSQSNLKAALYFDNIKDISLLYKLQHSYYAYGQQNGSILCGYFTHQYILQILTDGCSASCKEIRIDQNDVVDKKTYLKKWSDLDEFSNVRLEEFEDQDIDQAGIAL